MSSLRRTLALTAPIALLAILALPAHAIPTNIAQFVTNGSFEVNGGVGEIAPGITTLADWTVGAEVNGGPPYPFVFVGDNTFDTVGVNSTYSPPNPNFMIWGPGNGSNNGFTASPDGGDFFGAAAGFGNAPLSQGITGLQVGQQYTLSFYWAGAQATSGFGPTLQSWQVSLGSDTVDTPTANNASQGFTGWMLFSNAFTATSSTETLSFLANGSPAGVGPFPLLDGVSLTGPSAATPEFSTIAMMVSGSGGLLLQLARQRRNRRAAA
jgi:hypothetical protein